MANTVNTWIDYVGVIFPIFVALPTFLILRYWSWLGKLSQDFRIFRLQVRRKIIDFKLARLFFASKEYRRAFIMARYGEEIGDEIPSFDPWFESFKGVDFSPFEEAAKTQGLPESQITTTTLSGLNRLCDGDFGSTIIVAPPGQGKTTLLIAILIQALSRGRAHVFFASTHFIKYHPTEQPIDLRPLMGQFDALWTETDIVENIENLHKLMQARLQLLRQGLDFGEKIIFIVDEQPDLADWCKAHGIDLSGTIGQLLFQGRKVGIEMILASQGGLVVTLGLNTDKINAIITAFCRRATEKVEERLLLLPRMARMPEKLERSEWKLHSKKAPEILTVICPSPDEIIRSARILANRRPVPTIDFVEEREKIRVFLFREFIDGKGDLARNMSEKELAKVRKSIREDFGDVEEEKEVKGSRGEETEEECLRRIFRPDLSGRKMAELANRPGINKDNIGRKLQELGLS